MNRKKRLKIIQLSLFFLSILIIFYTYSEKPKSNSGVIISKEIQNQVDKRLSDRNEEGDTFYNVSYSGFDLSGNRYILKAEKAKNDEFIKEKILMTQVDAVFFFKDNTILKVWAEEGVYNNRTLDITFEKKVKALYEGSKLLAEKAEFSNSNSSLTITEKVKLYDKKGTLVADKLFFDLKKQTLNIVAFDNKKINANIDLK